jgi:hypothetical protein
MGQKKFDKAAVRDCVKSYTQDGKALFQAAETLNPKTKSFAAFVGSWRI